MWSTNDTARNITAADDAATHRRPPDSLGRYLKEISRTPLLTADQEVELAKRIEAGVYANELLDAESADARLSRHRLDDLRRIAADGAAAMDLMIRSNLRLVVSVAARSTHRFLPLSDLIQEGNIGLIRAVQKFDYTKGYKFSTYATWWIRQAIERAIASKGRLIRLPGHVSDEMARFDRVTRELRDALDHEPTVEEVADVAHIPVRRITEFRAAAQRPISLDALLFDDPQSNLGDFVVDTESPDPGEVIESEDIAHQVRVAVDRLPGKASEVIKLRYGLSDGMSHARRDTASRLGLSCQQAERLERSALRRLRRGALGKLMPA